MSGTELFRIGAEASCTDGACGEVTRVVIDPVARAVTHLVIEPKQRSGLAKLVPLDLVATSTDEVQLRCTLAAFGDLYPAEETHFLPGNNGGYGGYSPGQMVLLPHYTLQVPSDPSGDVPDRLANAFQPVVDDITPPGEVTVRRGDPVQATDGDIGRVQGLVIDPRNQHVTHVLLQEGHLWGRKEVAIPIKAVTRVNDGITVEMTMQDVRDLPDVDLAAFDEA